VSGNNSDQELLIVGLGGLGIRTAIALRATLELQHGAGVQNGQSRIRLLAIDARAHQESYLPRLDDKQLDGLHLDSSEFFGLLSTGQNPWDRVFKDAKLKIHEAEKLVAKRPAIEISRSPDRSDYQAMIYGSRERFRSEIKNFLSDSIELENEANNSPKIIVIASLFGDTGSLSYLELISILKEMSNEIRNASVHSFLISPNSFEKIFSLNEYQIAKYYCAIDSIYDLCLSEGTSDIQLNQQILSANSENFENQYFDKFIIIREMSHAIYLYLARNLLSIEFAEIEKQDSKIQFVSLNSDKCLEIRQFIVNRSSMDPRFSAFIRDLLN
jgi:hypothetical protein